MSFRLMILILAIVCIAGGLVGVYLEADGTTVVTPLIAAGAAAMGWALRMAALETQRERDRAEKEMETTSVLRLRLKEREDKKK